VPSNLYLPEREQYINRLDIERTIAHTPIITPTGAGNKKNMSNSKQEILTGLNLGDFSAYDYYGDDYSGEHNFEVYDNLEEASKAFNDDCEEAGIDALPLENYVNPITD
jgi:hypothetical protein